MEVTRSGAAVRGAVLTGGLSAVALAPLLEPWVTKALDVVAFRAGVALPPGYHAQALIAVTSVALWVSAHLKVRRIQGRVVSFEPEPLMPPADPPGPSGLGL